MLSCIWTAQELNGGLCRTTFPAFTTVWSYFRTWPSDWHLEADAYGIARTGAGEAGARAHAQRGHHRQSIGENEPKRGRRGYDGGKRVKGRKRHLLVDTMGLIVGGLVHEANIQDHDGGKELLWPLNMKCFPAAKKPGSTSP